VDFGERGDDSREVTAAAGRNEVLVGWRSQGTRPNQALHLTGAAIRVSRGILVLQAAPAGERGR